MRLMFLGLPSYLIMYDISTLAAAVSKYLLLAIY